MQNHDYLDYLARFVRVMTSEQISVHCFNGDHRKALRAIYRDASNGLVTVFGELIREHQASEKPIALVSPSQTSLTASQISYLASQRWSEVVASKVLVRGTAQLCAIYGGEVRDIAAASLSHECGLSEVFLRKRQSNSTFEWTLVQSGPNRGPQPDAVSGTVMVELIGRYNKSTVAAKLSLAAETTLELW